MADPIIEELWDIKDGIAREHGYDLDALVAHLRARRSPGDECLVDLSGRGDAVPQTHPIDRSGR